MATFIEFLQDKHASVYMGTDDDMTESFESWLTELQVDDFIEYADKFATKMYVRGKTDVTNRITNEII